MRKRTLKFFNFGLATLLFIVNIFTANDVIGQVTLAQWTFPEISADKDVDVYSTTPDNSLKEITVQRESSCGNAQTAIYTSFGSLGNPDKCASATNWSSGNNCKYWQIEVNTTGHNSILLSSKQRSSGTGPRDFKVQYKIGVSGTWTDITGGGITVADNFTTGVLNNLALPASCNNVSSLFIRWIMTSNSGVSSTLGDGGTSRIDDILITGVASSTNFYWNGNTTSGTGPSAGGTGSWNTTNTNWISPTDNASGTSTAWTNSTNNIANFTAGTGTGQVDIETDVISGGINIASSRSYAFTASTNHSITGDITVTGSLSLRGIDANLTINDALIGTGNLDFSSTGTGSVTLNGNSTHSGAKALVSGLLNLGHANALGASGSFNISGGSINNTNGAAITIPNYPQTWAGSFTFVGSNNLNMGTGAVSLSSASTITVSNSTLTVGGVISGAAALGKSGNGTLLLSGANTHSGGVSINAGTLLMGAANALGSGTVTLNGGTLKTGVSTGFSQSTGALHLTANSTIELGTGAHNLNFSSKSVSWTAGSTISISGWTGTPGSAGTAGRIFIGGTALSSAELDQINFSGYGPGATQIAGGEIVPRIVVLDWLNLQFPATATITVGGTMTAYARVFESGVTEAAGAPAGIQAWIGYSSTNDNPANPGWTWVPATWNAQVWNNDEFQATFGAALAPGTYYYASRFLISGGVYQYGGYSSGGGDEWDGSNYVSGVLTVNDNTANFANLHTPDVGSILQGEEFYVYAQVYEPGLTEAAGANPSISAWIGYSTSNTDPASPTGWTWVPATWNLQAGHNDEYRVELGTSMVTAGPGKYYYASRFQIGSGGYSYGGTNVSGADGGNFWDGSNYVSGVLDVADIKGNAITVPYGSTSTSTTNNTDFGNACVGSTVVKTFTIQNNSSGPNAVVISLGAASISPATDFTITSGPGTTINPGATASFDISFTPSSAGAKTATVTFVTDLRTYTFVISGTGIATVTPSVSITSNPAAVSGSTTICAGTSVTFTATPVNGGTPSYLWKINGSNTGTNSNTFTSTTLANGDVVTCEMTSTATCPSPATVTSNSITMVVNTVPAQPSAITGETVVCPGSSQAYSVTNDAGATGYTWTLPHASWTGSSTTNAISTIAGTTGGNISVTANNGCGSSTASSLAISIGSSPAVPVATTATAIDAGSFTANWNAVPGATGYFVDVYTNSTNAEDFTDGNFTSNPTWVGNTSNFSILTAATLPSGSAGTDGSYLGSNASTGHSTLLMPSTEVSEWQFSLGSPNFSPSSTNFFGVLLMSSTNVSGDLPAASFNGYYLKIGVNGSTDYIELWRSDNAIKTQIGNFSSAGNFNANALTNGLNLRITRSATGAFELFYSTGFTYPSAPTTSAGTVTDNTHTTSNYFGVFQHFESTSNDRRVYMDNIELGGLTYVTGYQNAYTTTNSLTVTDLTPGTTYYYVVRADNGTCTSGNSNQITVTTPTCAAASHTVTGIVPASGPVGTRVTITGTGFSAISKLKIGDENITNYTVVNSTTIIAQIPEGANTNAIAVYNSGCPKLSPTFTVLSSTGNCGGGGGATPSDLFISEIFDSEVGSRSYIELYNGTTSAINLSSYKLKIFTGATTWVDLSGTIAVGATFVVRIGNTGTDCIGFTYLNRSSVPGFNDNDIVELYKGSTKIDRAETPNNVGYSMTRNTLTGAPSTTFTPANWTITNNESCSNLGSPSFTSTPLLVINTHPVDKTGCPVGTVQFSVAATADPSPVSSYAWYYTNSTTMSGWQLVSGNITGATGTNTATLSLPADFAPLYNYQFYCEVSKTNGGNTCTIQSNAAQFSYPTKPYYRAITPIASAGEWNNKNSWQMSDDGSTGFVATCAYPLAVNSVAAQIPSGNKIIHSSGLSLDIDRLEIDENAQFEIVTSSALDVLNGDAANTPDLIVNGTLIDRASSGNGIRLNRNVMSALDAEDGTWNLGSNATIIKTYSSSSTEYGFMYRSPDGLQGISSIPATSNWIYRRDNTGVAQMTFASSDGNGGAMYYPNLTIENSINGNTYNSTFNATTPVLSDFTLLGAQPITIKGNWDIGGTGTGFINFLNINSNAGLISVGGNLTVRTGNVLRNDGDASNYGQGIDVKGNVAINGTLTNNGGAAQAGMLRFSGSTAQDVTGTGTMNLENVDIANSGASGNGVDVQRNFGIPGVLSFAGTSPKLSLTSGLVTLLSSNVRTASVGKIPAAAIINYGSGKFEIERYIRNVGNWNLIASPTAEAQTIYNSWQEGGANNAGYGTRITGPVVANGLDQYSIGYSMKWWDGNNAVFRMKGNTQSNATDSLVNHHTGYFLFARGDRSVPAGSTGSATTLRSRGKLYIGNSGSGITPPTINYTALAVGDFISIANPFASAIDPTIITASGLKQEYSVWDPTDWGSYGVGNYKTFSNTGAWLTTPSPAPPSEYPVGPYKQIQSGQAFMMEATGTSASVSFEEADKIDGSLTFSRTPQDVVMMSTMLHTADGNIPDGNRVAFDAAYSDSVGIEDATKILNSTENFGIAVGNKQIIIEGRPPLVETDTIFYRMANMRTQNYQLSFEPRNLGNTGLVAELIDQYLNSRTPVSLTDSTYYSFSITADAASKAVNRFMLLFRTPGGTVPVTFVNIAAQRQADRSIKLNWEVANETNIAHYEVERSADGSGFTGILTQDATNSRQYTKNDLSPLAADNYYRIKAIGLAGDITYSPIVKVAPVKEAGNIVLLNNPASNQRIQLRFNQMPAGQYSYTLSNSLGQSVALGKISISNNLQWVTLLAHTHWAAGMYKLSIIHTDGSETGFNVMLE